MEIRQLTEEREKEFLSEFACLSSESRGRRIQEDPCPVRTSFQHDRDKILHCKSFRRLKHKTQVFLAPEGDHYRTRLTHTLEVSQIARTIARALSLNEDLTEAIALGHDLGHTPFGHAGERVLDELLPEGFRHVRQSLRVVEVLEKDGKGLNLTEEVRDGILKHSKGRGPLDGASSESRAITLEGRIVRLADIVAYVNHDLDDALRAGLVNLDDIPALCLKTLGETHSRRINTMVCDLIHSSLEVGGGEILFSSAVADAVLLLRDWLFEHVYHIRAVHDDFEKATKILRDIFHFFMENEALFLSCGGKRYPGDSLDVSVADFIAGMTDRYVMSLYHKLFLPQSWKIV